MADLEGQFIGRYRLLRHLGAGGMATTYIAADTLLGDRQVTIEISPIHSNEQLQRKERESGILAYLNHPNILRTIDFGKEADIFYIVNEYTPEGTLRQRHPRGTRVPLIIVISYVKEMAAALQYVHDRGIVHRNVKPENMFITSDGRVVLGDFGLAIILSNETSDELMAGTPKYMAPEQFQGKSQPASDQYALGNVVYEWLSGQAPFSGTTPQQLIYKHQREQPPPLSAIVPEIPHEVEEVVMRTLKKDPKDRYPSVQAFADALEQASRPPISPIPTPFAGPTIGSPPELGAPQDGYDPTSTNASMPAINPDEQPASYGHSEHTQRQPYLPTVPTENVQPSSVSRSADETLAKSFSTGEEKSQQDTELSLFAIARTTLERDDRAIVGNTYTVQAGISQQREEDFRSAPFKISVQDPSQPILFHILFHPSKNIEMMGPPYQLLRYNPGNAAPQFISCPFRLKFSGRSYLLINFYRERQWLKTIRFEFDGIEQSMSSTARGRR